jgi:hypothetical protein
MLQLRALDTLGGADHTRLRARHHFAVHSQRNTAHAPRIAAFPCTGIAKRRSSRMCAKVYSNTRTVRVVGAARVIRSGIA